MKDNIREHKYLFHRGADHRSYEFLGAHPSDDGVVFRVWAPRAESISVVGSFNDWDTGADPMKQLADDTEIWEAFVAGAKVDDLYKFAVTTLHPAEWCGADPPGGPAGSCGADPPGGPTGADPTGRPTGADPTGRPDGADRIRHTVWKADPFAFFSESGGDPDSQRASIVYGINGEGESGSGFQWTDDAWMKARGSTNIYKAPVNIYEVHPGSWRRNEDGRPMTYRETADSLIDYAKGMGYTHIELLPIMEHPFDGSWGYQITGYYSPTSRYGRPEDLKYLINKAHNEGIGIIMDWVPAHFPKDEYGLARFDGYPLYEYSDELKGEYRDWGTLAFDFGRPEVVSFLISNAFYYCEQFHVDGLRVDAVAAMIYLNYGREDGEWIPNKDGGVENLEAIDFLRQMNRDVLTNFPGVITVAEESSAWPMVTKPPEVGGLGFNFKWNMGWMNDELEYFESDPIFRRDIHGKLIFSIDYAWSENFILPVSHDEVVHGKKSLLDKMPGEYDSKFDGFRTFMTYMFAHPGKKLTFMGTEFAQFIEWDESRQLDWLLLDYDRHRQAWEFVRDLNYTYIKEPALWSGDHVPAGFQWIDGGNIDDNVITFLRYAIDEEGGDPTRVGSPLVICLNLSGRDLENYKVGVPSGAAGSDLPGSASSDLSDAAGSDLPGAGEYVSLLDTDATEYGGKGNRTASSYKVRPDGWNGYENHIQLSLPALSGIILKRKEG